MNIDKNVNVTEQFYEQKMKRDSTSDFIALSSSSYFKMKMLKKMPIADSAVLRRADSKLL